MVVGIVFAMKEELDTLKKKIEVYEEVNIYNLTFYKAKYNNITCILVESGIGKVNAARTTQILIDKMNVDYIFNVGVAGGATEKLEIGDVIIAKSLVQHDFDLTVFNHEKGHIPNLGKYINCDNKLLSIAKKIDNVKFGVIASGDIFCSEITMFNKINHKFDALCVDMESAAISQVSYLCNVPFLVIRSISDKPNNNNSIDFNKFLESSSNKIAKIMLEILDNLN